MAAGLDAIDNKNPRPGFLKTFQRQKAQGSYQPEGQKTQEEAPQPGPTKFISKRGQIRTVSFGWGRKHPGARDSLIIV